MGGNSMTVLSQISFAHIYLPGERVSANEKNNRSGRAVTCAFLVMTVVLAFVLSMGSSAVFAQHTNQPLTPDNNKPGSVVPASVSIMCNRSL
jgi:Na+/proline symporter